MVENVMIETENPKTFRIKKTVYDLMLQGKYPAAKFT